MAIPSRFLKPAANRSPKKEPGKKPQKMPGTFAGKSTSAVSPTLIGVVLSVFAHTLIIAFGPRTDFSFAALTEAAQEQDTEETIVPLVNISPADRTRLPSFAQPRRTQPVPTGLDGLALPPGIPNTATRRVPPARARTTIGSRTQTRGLPSATPQSQTRRRSSLPSSITSRTLSPSTFSTRRTPSRSSTRTSQPTAVLPSGTAEQLDLSGITSSSSGLQLDTQQGLGTQNGVPAPPGTPTPNNQSPTGSASDLLTQAIEAAQANGSDANTASSGTSTEIARGNSDSALPGTEGEQVEVEVPVPVVDTASAQKDAPRLVDGFTYDERLTSQEDGEMRLEEWFEDTAENKADVVTADADLEIDSNFKVCKENPPNEGLIGVIVNPDGSQEDARVLRSIGYDILNRQALSAVEYSDFGQPTQPTHYKVSVDVIYAPDGCVESLPDVVE